MPLTGALAGTKGAAAVAVECQTKGGRATYDGYWHTWWVRTPEVGMAKPAYMSEIFLVGGGNDEPDTGLPTC